MKRLLISTLSAAAITAGMATPAFAYVVKHESINVQTSPFHNGRPAKRIIMTRFGSRDNTPTVSDTDATRTRSAAVDDTTGRSNLQRHTRGRLLRRLNRMPKANTDRYRTLDLRPNSRSLRNTNLDRTESYLPSTLVQTGGTEVYDRPTRRDIRENSLTNVNDRDRNILAEIKNSARNN